MKVLYILNIFPKISETFVLNEILAMQRKGVEVEVFAEYPSNESAVHSGVREVSYRYFRRSKYLPVWSALGHLCMLARHPFRYLATWRAAMDPKSGLRKVFFAHCFDAVQASWTRPDHLHAHFADQAADRALMIHLLTGIPFSFTTHSYELFEEPPANFSYKSRLAQRHITISEFNKQFAAKNFGVDPSNVFVIHCGVDMERLRAVPDQAPLPNLIVSVARLDYMKGLDNLVRACAKLKKEGIDFECVVLGEGPERPKLEALIREHALEKYVKLPGNQTQEQVFGWLKKARLKVLPSRTLESMGVALMEAMALGVPVIGPQIHGVPELVQDGVNGFLVKPEEVDILADRIKKLLSDEGLRARFKEAGYAKVASDFNLKTETDKLLEIWKQP